MKFYITGCSRGLGQHLCNVFDCIGFDRVLGNDIEHDINKIIEQIELNSVVILNAHAAGSQIKYMKRLYNKVKLVVCGSIASTNFDIAMPEYSIQKYDLEQEFNNLAIHSKIPMLYLKLTSSSYANPVLIENSIRFWLANPEITFIGYNISD